ncbi:XIAP-like protein [Mya arenaria]|uniref:XIAP-like protein n=1 Tax=Mya arenaria TaxID=6604 RepID=A0ABY7ECV0_MYAAR|nr:XIAP-like protein [Mya arenaria]
MFLSTPIDITYRRPEYASYEARLATYNGWPEKVSQKPYQLADAGLYFTGTSLPNLGKDVSNTKKTVSGNLCAATDNSAECAQVELGHKANWGNIFVWVDLNSGPNHVRSNFVERTSEGVEDHVRCFACDGGLRQWNVGDYPWVEHCRWFPACPFARRTKGDQYIAQVQASVEQGEDFSELHQEKSPEDIVTSGIDNITLGSPELEEHQRTCTEELGFHAQEFEEALIRLRTSGNIRPALEDLIFCIGDIQKQREIQQFQQETVAVDTPESILEENARLKHILKCQMCNDNNVNALFLPCAHHRICTDCASKYDVTVCIVCDRPIREIVETFMG